MAKRAKGGNAASSAADTSRYHVPNVNRALMILEFLAAHSGSAGISDIARELDVPKNSVFRIVSTLHAHGYLIRDEADKSFRLSRKLLSLGYAAVDEHNLIDKSLDVMRQLRDEVDETVLVGTLIDNQGVVIEQVPSTQPVKVLIRVGHHFPLHTAAPGKAMLAFLPQQELDGLLPRLRLTKFTERTITTRPGFVRELDEVRRLGYALDRGEEVEDLRCAGAPILNHRGHALAALWVTGPASRMPQEKLAGIGQIVRDHTAIISRRFGYGLLEQDHFPAG